eukprot:SM000021S06409  [mRNA]  locus=s21:17072:19173:- [translate_table: standard]
MKFMLMKKFGFEEANIITLTELETEPTKWPTRANMLMAMYWLVTGCAPGDSLVFQFSGHGSQQRNRTGEEADGFDETICPVDFERAGMIVDDEINARLVRPIAYGVKLTAVIDACHSGTVLDLPFLCTFDRYGRFTWKDDRPPTLKFTGTSGGEAFCFSGCDDSQTSADTAALSRVTSTGAMTFCFIQAIERGHAQTYGSTLDAMRHAIRATNQQMGGGGGGMSPLLDMLISGGSMHGGLTQVPQLTASSMFDINRPFTI